MDSPDRPSDAAPALTLMPSELKYAILTVAALGLCTVFKGGRVLVLPLLFILALILVFWAAKPQAED
jgi:hypothetical protein